MTPAIRRMAAENRNGTRFGLPSFCTANEEVLDRIFAYAGSQGLPLLVEATCNQVNQDGGYTGMKPADFVEMAHLLAQRHGLDEADVLLGGDHLGPNPWRHLTSVEAMANARDLVRHYVEAGFTKIHLDASMACADEASPGFDLVAARAADLVRVAENHAPQPERLVYVIGTEVPTPGGETDGGLEAIEVTTPESLERTITAHRRAFAAVASGAAWSRVVSVVTQPGVDFSPSTIHRFDRARAAVLSNAILAHAGLTFEAHSTDYQTREALCGLVDSHFLFLKVGPELTFAYREAILALAHIEERLRPGTSSRIEQVILREMDNDPRNWSAYYSGTEREIELLKLFGFSDRIRYYWGTDAVRAALAKLRANVASGSAAEGLVRQYAGWKDGTSCGDELYDAVVGERLRCTLDRYFQACNVRGRA